MTKRQQSSRSFSTPSPGALLRSGAARRRFETMEKARREPERGDVEVGGDPFSPSPFVAALRERGVMLAPLLVQWNYKVRTALPYAKWLKSKEVLLSGARFMVNDETAGIHYFGTYVLQGAPEAGEANTKPGGAVPGDGVVCQTLWGFSDEAAMLHMFELCRGRVERVSIVESDLRDFVVGLKGFVNEAGASSFTQSVLVSPAAM